MESRFDFVMKSRTLQCWFGIRHVTADGVLDLVGVGRLVAKVKEMGCSGSGSSWFDPCRWVVVTR